jgi:hypothetical protein
VPLPEEELPLLGDITQPFTRIRTPMHEIPASLLTVPPQNQRQKEKRNG